VLVCPAIILSIARPTVAGDKSPYHSLTRILANKRRKLVTSPDLRQVTVRIAVRSGGDSNYCSSISAIASGKLKGLPHSGHFDDPNK